MAVQDGRGEGEGVVVGHFLRRFWTRPNSDAFSFLFHLKVYEVIVAMVWLQVACFTQFITINMNANDQHHRHRHHIYTSRSPVTSDDNVGRYNNVGWVSRVQPASLSLSLFLSLSLSISLSYPMLVELTVFSCLLVACVAHMGFDLGHCFFQVIRERERERERTVLTGPPDACVYTVFERRYGYRRWHVAQLHSFFSPASFSFFFFFFFFLFLVVLSNFNSENTTERS